MTKLTEVMPSRIRELRLHRGWTQDELAKRADTTPVTISRLERSTRGLSIEWVDRLAAALGISSSEMITGDAPAGLQRVPVVGRIAAGNWREAVEEANGWVGAYDVGPNVFALEPDGDSMDLITGPKAVLVVDPDQVELRDGLIYAICNEDGETTVKQYRAEPARLEPRSSNPVHQPILLGGSPFRVIGRVVQSITHF